MFQMPPRKIRADNLSDFKTEQLISVYRGAVSKFEKNFISEEILNRVMSHIKKSAKRSSARLFSTYMVDADDMVQEACIRVLTVCIERYTEGSFEKFCSKHIKGAMLDECRRRQAVPRRTAADRRLISEMSAIASHELGYYPNKSDLYEMFGQVFLDADERFFTHRGVYNNFEKNDGQEGDGASSQGWDGIESMIRSVEHDEFMPMLSHVTEENDAKAILMYYAGDMNCRQIADELNRTDSCISKSIKRGLSQIEVGIRIERHNERKKEKRKIKLHRGVSWYEVLTSWLEGCEKAWQEKKGKRNV